MKKSAISTAVMTALGLGVGAANAAPVAFTGLTIEDVGSNTANAPNSYSSTLDGISGSFIFNSKYLNVNTYAGTSSFTGDVGTGTMLEAARQRDRQLLHRLHLLQRAVRALHLRQRLRRHHRSPPAVS